MTTPTESTHDGGPFDRVRAAIDAAALAVTLYETPVVVRADEALAEIERELANRDKVIAECARAVGASVSAECSDEFRAMLPDEIRGRVTRLDMEYDAIERERDELRAELERERMRLAACGVIAMCDTPESAARARDMHPEYFSASCGDVIRRVDECMRLRKENEDLRAKLAELTTAHSELLCNYLSACERKDSAEAMLAAAPSAPGMVTREELARADEKIEAQRDSLREHMAMVRERDTEITTLRARIAELERDAARVDTDGHPLVLIRREIVENFARSTNVPRFRRICESALAASDKAMEAGK